MVVVGETLKTFKQLLKCLITETQSLYTYSTTTYNKGESQCHTQYSKQGKWKCMPFVVKMVMLL